MIYRHAYILESMKTIKRVKIKGSRMNEVFKTNNNCVGFKPVYGCTIDFSWLHSLLKHARINRNNSYVCLIDA
jgi:hypothetical protein